MEIRSNRIGYKLPQSGCLSSHVSLLQPSIKSLKPEPGAPSHRGTARSSFRKALHKASSSVGASRATGAESGATEPRAAGKRRSHQPRSSLRDVNVRCLEPRSSGGRGVPAQWLDLTILKVFPNLNGSLIFFSLFQLHFYISTYNRPSSI